MAKRAKLNRSEPENIAIRAQVNAFMGQGLPEEQAQAAAFKMFRAGEIAASSAPRPAKGPRSLIRNLASRRKTAAAAAIAAGIASGRRTKSGRKRRIKSK